ncbi:MAG: UDP-3-O-acyl-N-acetylglucosamine deacetylase, partial [Candidatus Krumholzibacteriota bacterium]|nr:UDP-3-O-acyl-N-acetylglucosamine deacetylase [Candidatus Krumholzibacteriota bacterium]
MVRQQRTIKDKFSFEGIGLHTGKKVKIVFCPAPPDTGIVFRRTDIDPVVEIPARADFILNGEIKRNTTITRDQVVIHTVEHILAAVSGLQVDNLVMEINADEPPEPKDGSCAMFVDKFQRVGFSNQGVPVQT